MPSVSKTSSSRIISSDARQLGRLIDKKTIDLIVTSPPYWKCRDYGHRHQIGQEKSPKAYIDALTVALNSWKPLLRPSGSVILNIGDRFHEGKLLGLPVMFEMAVRTEGWQVVNRIIWAKDRGVPEPGRQRLARRYEFIYHLSPSRRFFFDLFALEQYLGQSSNPGDVWQIKQTYSASDHLAPFPTELARRAILVACPERICPVCGKPHLRRLKPTIALDKERPQARRALEIYGNSNLTAEHIAAIRAVGISDAGKALHTQNGANKNAASTIALAKEAKEVLGGYFREFTFAPKRHAGWSKCTCNVDPVPGTVLDPFMGSGTTLVVATELGRNAIGADLRIPQSWPPAPRRKVRTRAVSK